MSGLVRFIVVERLNGLLVVTPRAEHLARVREWVTRLDRNTGDASPRLFIYRVQNGKATDLADALNRLFNPAAPSDEPSLAPGLEPATIGNPAAGDAPESLSQTDRAEPPPPPVCGCDGKTYANACNAKAAGVTRFTEGECEAENAQ